jgi:protease-4
MAGNRRTAAAIFVILLIFAGGVWISGRLALRGGGFLAGRAVAILPIEGIITSERRVLANLESLRHNGAVRAFVVEIRSPGGTVGASQAIYHELRKLRDDDERPVVAWMGDIAASGGYYVALASDSVFALPGTITGSIGVIMEFPNARELLRKVGVGWEVVKSGEHKDLASPARPLSEADREILESVVLDAYEQFVDAVVLNRPLTRDEILPLADGRIFTGAQASELGLIDGTGTLREAVDVAGRMAGLGEGPRTIRPHRRRLSLLDIVLGVGDTSLGRLLGWAVELPGPTPRLLYEWR